MMSDSLHFIGIGGVGMSALARIALARGLRVSGSSDKASETTRKLEREGAKVIIGHSADNIRGVERVIITSAVQNDNPELIAARNASIPVVRRGELLAELFNAKRGIAISGTHGKTTVTSMLATALEQAEFDPTVAVGGERRETGTNFRCGASEWFVSEADESDGSFLALRPHVAIVTNIENDHVTSDQGVALLLTQFGTFLAGLANDALAVVCVDEPHAQELSRAPRAARTVTYGFSPSAMYRGVNPMYAGFTSHCTLLHNGVELGVITLGVPGAINLANAIAAATVALELGVPFARVANALATFGGVRRRFDILSRHERMLVVDDYAHHPTAIAATIDAARRAHRGPLVVAFQAHRYTRTQYLAEDFARALVGADHVILTEIYAASELPIEGVDERMIGEPLARAGGDVSYVRRADVTEHLLTHAPRGALVLMLGAGDITAAARELASRIEEKAAVA